VVAKGVRLLEEGDHTRHASLSFTPEPRLVTDARRGIGECMERWGLGAERPALQLVASELFTNAIRHGRGRVTFRVDADDDIVRLEVSDQGRSQPALQPVDPSGTVVGGWGLHLVDQLVDAWGSEVRDGHTVFWAERAIRRQ
jgi:anti-sigma regulatory factor (Ser/Thr protein kinase)